MSYLWLGTALCEAALASKHNRLGAVASAELAEQVVDMCLHRCLAHDERVGNLSVRVPLCNVAQHFTLAVGQASLVLGFALCQPDFAGLRCGY